MNRDDTLLEMIALAKEKGYAIDISIYGGEHLDVFHGGLRITGLDDPMSGLRAGVKDMQRREPNRKRAEQLERQAALDGYRAAT
jgi:hypothetical protein